MGRLVWATACVMLFLVRGAIAWDIGDPWDLYEAPLTPEPTLLALTPLSLPSDPAERLAEPDTLRLWNALFDNPGDARIPLLLGYRMLRTNDPERASDFLREGLSADHSAQERRFAAWVLGQTDLRLGKTDQVLADFEPLTSDSVLGDMASVWVAYAYLASGDFEAVQAMLEALPERLVPELAIQRDYLSAIALIRTQREREALVPLRALTERFSTDTLGDGFHYLMGWIYFRAGVMDSAILSLSNAVTRRSPLGLQSAARKGHWLYEAYFLLGGAYLLKVDNLRAETYFKLFSLTESPGKTRSLADYFRQVITLSTPDYRAAIPGMLAYCKTRAGPDQESHLRLLLGRRCMESGAYDSVLLFLEPLVADSALPGRNSALTLIGDACYAAKRYDSAEGFYRRLPVDTPYRYWGLSCCLARRGQTESAAVVLDSIAAHPEPLPESFVLLRSGRLWSQTEHPQNALTRLQGLLDCHPSSAEADEGRWLMAKVYHQLGQEEMALAMARAVLARSPSGKYAPDLLALSMNALMALKRYPEAVELFESGRLDRLPTALREEAVLLGLRASVHTGRLPSPLDVTRRFVIWFPNSDRSAQMLLEMADYYVGQTHPDSAEAIWGRVIEHFGNTVWSRDAVHRLIASLLDRQNPAQVARYPERWSLGTLPRDLPAIAWNLIGDAARGRDDPEGAIGYYRQAIDAASGDPATVPAYLNLAELYQSQGLVQESQTIYDQVARRFGVKDAAIMDEVALHRIQGLLDHAQPEKAIQAAERALTTVGAATAGAVMGLWGDAVIALDQPDSAITLYQSALRRTPESDPRHFRLVVRLARAEILANRPDPAARRLRIVLARCGDPLVVEQARYLSQQLPDMDTLR